MTEKFVPPRYLTTCTHAGNDPYESLGRLCAMEKTARKKHNRNRPAEIILARDTTEDGTRNVLGISAGFF